MVHLNILQRCLLSKQCFYKSKKVANNNLYSIKITKTKRFTKTIYFSCLHEYRFSRTEQIYIISYIISASSKFLCFKFFDPNRLTKRIVKQEDYNLENRNKPLKTIQILRKLKNSILYDMTVIILFYSVYTCNSWDEQSTVVRSKSAPRARSCGGDSMMTECQPTHTVLCGTPLRAMQSGCHPLQILRQCRPCSCSTMRNGCVQRKCVEFQQTVPRKAYIQCLKR